VWFGLLAGGAVLAFLSWRWRLDLLALADSLAPGLMVFAAGLGIANLFSGDYYGVETGVFWGISLWGAKRHPTQIYLILACLGCLAVLWRLHGLDNLTVRKSYRGRKDSLLPQPGLIAQVSLLLISLSILLIEPLRADSPVIGPGLRVWQIVALVGLVGGLASLAYRPPDIHHKTA
jgi:prolipoprotein diacylglyceryltransferase